MRLHKRALRWLGDKAQSMVVALGSIGLGIDAAGVPLDELWWAIIIGLITLLIKFARWAAIEAYMPMPDSRDR